MKTALVAASSFAMLVGSAGLASAQDSYVPAGTPQEGVQVDYRQSPGQSQQMLQSPPADSGGGGEAEGGEGVGSGGSSNPFSRALERRQGEGGGGEGAEGEGGGLETGFASEYFGLARSGEPVWVFAEDIYTGVIPGTRDTLPHISRYQARADSGPDNYLTWIGFQPFDEFTRVFLQTGRTARYQVSTSPDGMTLTLRLSGTRIGLTNFLRDVDSSWFDRSVHSIDAYRMQGGDAEVVIVLNESANYTIEQEGNYIYIDFQD